MKLHEFLVIVNSRQDLIDFLTTHNVMNSNMMCRMCNNNINLNINTLQFKCNRLYFIVNAHKKRVKVKCPFTESARKNTWFDKSKLSIEKICRFVAYFIMLRPPRHDFLKSQLDIDDHTIVDWQSFCREVLLLFVNIM